MKQIYDVAVIGSGFGGRIARINFEIEFDPEIETMHDFKEKCLERTWMSGYTAILNWKSINGEEKAISAFVCAESPKLDKLGKRILEISTEMKAYEHIKTAIKESERTGVAGPDTKFWEQTQEWFYSGEGYYGCGYDQACSSRSGLWDELKGINETLEALGFDPAEKESIKRICENLGLYRVEMKVY